MYKDHEKKIKIYKSKYKNIEGRIKFILSTLKNGKLFSKKYKKYLKKFQDVISFNLRK